MSDSFNALRDRGAVERTIPDRGDLARTISDRALGAYLGLAIGDALGATVEFMTPGEIARRTARTTGCSVAAGSSSSRAR